MRSAPPPVRAPAPAAAADPSDAARLLGIPSGTVKTRMMRARAQLREELS